MGTQLVRHVVTLGMGGRLAKISPNARTVLYVMAATAHDIGTENAPPATYFAGWPLLAGAGLGRPEYDEAARQAVRRVIAELIGSDLIAVVGRRHGVRTGHAMYELRLW